MITSYEFIPSGHSRTIARGRDRNTLSSGKCTRARSSSRATDFQRIFAQAQGQTPANAVRIVKQENLNKSDFTGFHSLT